jgi:FMN reductase
MLAVDYALKPVLNALKAQEVLHGVFADDSQITHYDRQPELSPVLRDRINESIDTFWSALARRHRPLAVAV